MRAHVNNARVLLAIDKFKGSITSADAAAAVAEGMRGRFEVEILPMADGGDGFFAALEGPLALRRYPVPDCCGVFPGSSAPNAFYGGNEEQSVAVVEMATVCGLAGLNETNIMRATTRGLGQLIGAAAAAGFRKIVVGLGGSATNDAGLGALQALGVSIHGVAEGTIATAEHLSEVRGFGNRPVILNNVELLLASDVVNPFSGPNGAVAVFSAQKGASSEQQKHLEAGMLSIEALFPPNSFIEGSGAAGGTAGGLSAVLGASIVSGLELLARYAQLDAKIDAADILITGEGCFDSQSMDGKVVGRLLAKAHGKRRIIVCGKSELEAPQGVELYSISHLYGLEAALKSPAECLTKVGQQIK